LQTELLTHLPFSVSSVTLGLIFAGIICFLTPDAMVAPIHADHAAGPEGDRAHDAEYHGSFIELFHLFHPAHMLFSAAATTAMFRKYDRRRLRALVVGFTGAVVVCGLGDIAFPHLSLMILGKAPEHVHICIVQHPGLVFPFAAVGVALGWVAAASVERATFYSHSLHVFISTMATIFYLVGPIGRVAWIEQIGAVFCFSLVAVMLPCCFSDILYPVFFTRRGRADYAHSEHAHKH
jgi:hypothetical protein